VIPEKEEQQRKGRAHAKDKKNRGEKSGNWRKFRVENSQTKYEEGESARRKPCKIQRTQWEKHTMVENTKNRSVG